MKLEIRQQFVENRDLISGVSVGTVRGGVNACQACGKSLLISSTARVLCGDDSFYVCTDCFLTLVDAGVFRQSYRHPEFLKRTSLLHTSMLTSGRFLDLDADESLLDALVGRLEFEEPEFCDVWREFKEGSYTLESGEQDELLKSISQQVASGKPPTNKQISAFRERCDFYVMRKKDGLSLKQPDELRVRGDDLSELLATAHRVHAGFIGTEEEFHQSISDFAKSRGYLTEKQAACLRRNIEKAEARL